MFAPARLSSPRRKTALILAGSIAALLGGGSAQAANTIYTLNPGASGNWSTTSNWNPTTIGSITAGDVATYVGTVGAATISLDVPVTVGSISIGAAGTQAWTINASGSIAFTLDGTGITAGNQMFGNAGVAAIGSRGVGANMTINPDIVLTNTDLDMGNTNTGTLTIGGNITATTAQALNFRGSGAGTVTINGNIGASGSNIAITDQRAGGGNVTIAGTLGSSVTSLTKAAGGHTLTLSSAANAYAGGTTLNGGMLYYNGTATSGTPFGTGSISLVQANGAGTNSSNNGTSTAATTLLSINPQGSGSAIALTGGTTAGSTFSFAGGSYLSLNKGTQTSLSYTFGPGSGTVLNRVGRGTLAISPSGFTSPTINTLSSATGERFLVSGNAPTITNGMVDPYILASQFGSSGQGTFVTYDNTTGFTPVTYDLTNTFTGTTNAKKVLITSATNFTSSGSAYALDVNGGGVTITGGVTLTLGDGTHAAGLIVNNATALSGGTIDFGSSEGVIYVGGTSSTISSAIAGTNGITKTQYVGTNGALTLSGLNTYTGTTTVNNGTLTFSNAGNQSHGALDGIGTVANAVGSGTLTFTQAASTTYNIGTLTNSTATGATGAFTLNAGLNSVTTIGTVNGASGSQVIFGGDATGSTTISNQLNTGGQTVNVSAGTVSLGSSRNTADNLIVSGGTLTTTGTNRLSMANNDNQTLTISSGTLNVLSTADFGLRLGGDNGAGQGGVGFTGTLSGGTINALGANGVTLGSNSASKVTSFSQTVGSFNIGTASNAQSLVLGADTGGTSTTTYNLSGGKLVVSGAISGSQGAGAKQAFVWTGGTLAAGTYTATNLTSALGTAVSGSTNTLTNAGGTLAPGDIGTGGKTVITGNYNVTSSNAVYAVDLGSATIATAFQSGAAFYDTTTVSGTLTVGGKLNVSLINGFTPAAANTFNIFSGATSASGSFTNVNASNNRVNLASGTGSMIFTLGTTSTLTGYGAGSDLIWTGAASTTWDTTAVNFTKDGVATEFNNADFVTFDQSGIANNTITLNTALTPGGVTFSNTSSTYTLTGTGGIGGTGALTKSGAGTVVLSTANTYTGGTTVNGGTLMLSGAGTLGAVAGTASLTVTSGVLDLNGTSQNVDNFTGAGGSVFNNSGAGTSTLQIGSNNGTGGNFAGVIADNDGVSTGGKVALTKAGSGTLTLSGANNYTGSTTLNAGTLTLTGSLSSPTLNLAGGTFAYSKTGTNTQTFTTTNLTGYAVVNNTVATDTLKLGNIVRTSPGTVNFATTTGAITTSSSNDASNILGPWATIGTGTALNYAVANGDSTAISTYASGTALTTAGGGTAGTTNFTLGNASVTLTASATGNTLQVLNTDTTGITLALGANNLTLNGILNSGGASGGLTISGGGKLFIGGNNELDISNNAQNTTIGSIIANNGGTASSVVFTSISGGSLTLTGVNTYTGGTFVNAGTVNVGNNTAKLGTGAVTLAAGTTLTFNASGDTESTFAPGGITGAGNLFTSIGNQGSTTTLDKVNTYTGTTTIGSRGSLKINVASTYDVNGVQTGSALGLNSPIVISSTVNQSELWLNGNSVTVGAISGGSSSQNVVQSGIVLGKASGTSATLTVGGDNGSANFTGYISDAAFVNQAGLPQQGASSTGGSLIKIGTGTQTLGPTGQSSAVFYNNYGGPTVVNGGTLAAGTTEFYASGVDKGGAFGLNSNVTVNSLTAGATASLAINSTNVVAIGSLTVGGTGATATSTNNVSVGSGLLLLGGNVTVNATNNPLGATITATPSQGVLELGASRTFTVGSSTNSGGADLTIGAIIDDSSTAGVTTSGVPGTLVHTGTTGAYGITKAGAGTMVLTATNTYTGPTAVTGGTLEISGSIGGAIGTAISVSSGTLLLSGAGTDRITTGSTLDLGTGGVLRFASGGGLSETIGALTLSGDSSIDFSTGTNGNIFRFSSLDLNGHALSIYNWTGAVGLTSDNGSPATQDRFLFDSSTLNDPSSNPNDFAQISFYSGSTLGTFLGTGTEIAFGGSGTGFEVVPIPEPSSTALLGGAALLGLVGFRESRRRFRKVS